MLARLTASILIALSFGTAAHSHAQPLPDAPLDARLNEEVIMMPSSTGDSGLQLETTIFRPSGPGPFPLLIMNHGKQPGDPRAQGRDRFVYLSREFVRRGYAVMIPMRTGFAHSGGEYTDYGCNMTANGYLQANDIRAALDWARTQPWVDAAHIIVAGQSYGGLATMAAGAADLPGVRGLINFAGGLRSDDDSCPWQSGLEAAFTAYGAHSGLPSLWFYGQNDSYFGPALAAQLRADYVRAGGRAELVAYGPFKRDAHGLAGSQDGFAVWWPETRKFLERIDMPTEATVAIADDVPLPASRFAALNDVEAIPYLHDGGRSAYRAFLDKETPRAFAVAPNGAWSWAEEGEDPEWRALAACRASSGTPCKLYAVDDRVVWNDAPPVPANLADAAPATGGSIVDAAGTAMAKVTNTVAANTLAVSARPLAPAAPTLPLQGE